MINLNWNRKLREGGNLSSNAFKRLVLLLTLVLLLIQACSIVGQNPAPSLTPVFSSTQRASGKTSVEPTLTPGKILTLETVYPPSPTPTSEPTRVLELTPSPTKTQATIDTPSDVPTEQGQVVFAVIGDYGSHDAGEGEVADLVKSWNPDFIITLGDNNYPNGAWDTMDEAVGQYYHSYIYPYTGSYGDGSDINRFFPSIGNHDLLTDYGKPYLDYFFLPGNERYYDFVWEPLHFFALDNISDSDGVNATSVQAQWLKQNLAASTSAWNIVYMHFPPYSTGIHGSTDWARWPYAEWGADVVLAGHNHVYERIEVDGLIYFVNGLGGIGEYDFLDPIEGIQVRYNTDLGAMRVEATDLSLEFEFINRGKEGIDTFTMNK